MAMGAVAVAHEPASAAEPWQELYRGKEATGTGVLGLWQFLPGAENRDSGGKGYDLTLRGESRFVPEGKFGPCLESFSPGVQRDKAQGALVANSVGLTPAGTFTMEMWIKPKPELDSVTEVRLLDKMYLAYRHKVRSVM